MRSPLQRKACPWRASSYCYRLRDVRQQLLQHKPIESLAIPVKFRDVVGGCVRPSRGALKRIRLLGGRKQLELGARFHVLNAYHREERFSMARTCVRRQFLSFFAEGISKAVPL